MLLKLFQATLIMTTLAMFIHPSSDAAEFPLVCSLVSPAGEISVQTESNTRKPDIQWFKDRMKISEKYSESQKGIMGVSWAHFIFMVLLVLFGIAALVMFIQRQRRTREILKQIRKEMTHGDSG